MTGSSAGAGGLVALQRVVEPGQRQALAGGLVEHRLQPDGPRTTSGRAARCPARRRRGRVARARRRVEPAGGRARRSPRRARGPAPARQRGRRARRRCPTAGGGGSCGGGSRGRRRRRDSRRRSRPARSSARSIGTSVGPCLVAQRAQVLAAVPRAEHVGQVDAGRVHARPPPAAGRATGRARTRAARTRRPSRPKRRRCDAMPVATWRWTPASVASSGRTAWVAAEVQAACGASAPSRSRADRREALARAAVVGGRALELGHQLVGARSRQPSMSRRWVSARTSRRKARKRSATPRPRAGRRAPA